jgi:truncated hemoglobin YjbI
MDINLISIFPSALLKNLLATNDVGCFFMHISDGRYSHMMSKMMCILLGNEPFTPELVHSLYDRHAHMKLSRKEYKAFMEVFNNTLHELEFPCDQIATINHRIKTLLIQLHSVRHNERIDLMESMIKKIDETTDLNAIRGQLVNDLRKLQDCSYNSLDMGPISLQKQTSQDAAVTNANFNDCITVHDV